MDGMAARVRPPDGQHVFGQFRAELVKQVRQLVNPTGGLTDGRIEKKQNALKHIELHAYGLGGNDNRLTARVVGDLLGEVATDPKRALQDATEFAGIAFERGAFKPAYQLAGDRHKAASRPHGGDIEIDENKPAFFRGGQKEETCQVIPARLSAHFDARGLYARELPENARRSPRIAGESRRDDGSRLRVDGLNEPKRQLNELGFFLGAVVGLLDIKVGDHA